MSGIKSPGAVVLAFYPDGAGGLRALRKLRESGLRRSAAIQRTEAGTLITTGNRSSHRWYILVTGAVLAGLLTVSARQKILENREELGIREEHRRGGYDRAEPPF